MIRLISVLTLGFILLIFTITYAGDELSPAEKNLIFKPTNDVVSSSQLTSFEMTTTTGQLVSSIMITLPTEVFNRFNRFFRLVTPYQPHIKIFFSDGGVVIELLSLGPPPFHTAPSP